MRRPLILLLWVLACCLGARSALAEEKANPPLAEQPAKLLFGAKKGPADLQARSIGFYSRGCLAGGVALPVNGKTWQVMRVSRNRNWGHPKLVAFLERLANRAPKVGWPGLLVGDLAQPRGGPMLTGHASHQIGLDADIWLTPMPDRVLSADERETLSPVKVVASDKRDVDPSLWTPQHTALIRAAAKEPDVERIFVNAAIKKALCREAGNDRGWLHKVRPYWGHDYHFHVRMRCPDDSPECKGQPPAGEGDGCGSELASWFRDEIINPKPAPPGSKPPPKPRPAIRLSELPSTCQKVLAAP